MSVPSERPLPDPETVIDALEVVAQSGILGSADPMIFDVGTEGFLAFFDRELLSDLVAHGGSTCRFIEGGYGAGKTHLLHLLRGLALERGMTVIQTDLNQDLGLDDWYPITKTILQHIEARIDGVDVRGLPHILEALRRSGRSATASLHGISLPHVGFRNAMMYGVTEDDPPADLNRYLHGERVSARRLLEQGLPGVKEPLARRNSEVVLATVCAALQRFGLAGTMLLFDETEQTMVSERAVVSTKMRVAANLMRRLIDGCMTGRQVWTAVVFAVLPGFIETCTRQYPALGQRLEMARGQDVVPAWRWPVLPIDAVTMAGDPGDFLRGAVERFVLLVGHCGGDESGLKGALMDAGNEALAEQAGSGYRRPLMKRLATISLQRLEMAV